MSDAKEYLRQVKLYDTQIECKLDELDRLKGMITKITTTLKQDVVSGGGNQDKLGDAVARIIDLQDEINNAIDAYVDLKSQVCSLLDRITDSDQLGVLYKRYIQHKQWEEIACEMGYTYRNVCYIHGKALQAVDRLLKKDAGCRK